MSQVEHAGGPRNIVKRATLEQLFEWIKTTNDIEERKRWLSVLVENYTPREIYENNYWTTGINHQVPDGHVRFALESFQCEPYYPVRQAATNMLVDGFVLWRYAEEEVDGDDPDEPDLAKTVYDTSRRVLEDPHLVKSVEFRHEELKAVEIEYQYSEYDSNDNEVIWVYNAIFTKNRLGQTLRIMRCQLDDPERTMIVTNPELTVWPYIGIQWETGQSILAPVMSTIARYEMCLQNIGHENDRHSRRKAVYEGTYKMDKSPMLMSSDEEREHLPAGAKKYYPDTQPDGLAPMFEERKILEDEIRQTIGLIKVYPLHNASGTSREIEIRPQLAQAMALRQRIVRMMLLVDSDCHVHFGPLEKMPPQELDMFIGLLESAWLEKTITDHEYTSTKRMLLGFPDVPLANSHGITADRNMALQLIQPQQPQAAGGKRGA